MNVLSGGHTYILYASPSRLRYVVDNLIVYHEAAFSLEVLLA
jgi:hypothetical protein